MVSLYPEHKVRRLGYLFFFVSGGTALIYEVIWLRLLGLVFGNTTHAVSTILAAYMAGLGFGSFWVGYRVDRWKNSLAAYGLLEIGIGAYAALTFVLLGLVQTLYVAFVQQVSPSPLLFTAARLILSFAVFFIPTFFMGATLPVLITFYVKRSKAVGSETALLYGLNTAGAVLGTFLTGFVLLPFYNMQIVLWMAVTLNIGIGLLACLFSKGLKDSGIRVPETGIHEAKNPVSSSAVHWLPIGLLISGITAMIYEVSWTRILATVLGSSTYAFTLMLGTFLLGLAIGSAVYQRVLAKRNAALSDWGWLQLSIALSVLVTLPFFAKVGFVSIRLYALSVGNFTTFQLLQFLVCALFMFIPTFCFGATFPVSTAIYTRDPKLVGRKVGTLYLANTIGNIIGSLGAGFLLIPFIGIHHSFLVAIGIGGAVGLFALWGSGPFPARQRLLSGGLVLFLIAGIGSMRKGWDPHFITSGFHIRPQDMVGWDVPSILARSHSEEILFYREGLNGIISVNQQGDQRTLKVNGKPDASNGIDMATQLLSGHLPHLLHPDPKKTLVIGFGSGTTHRACLMHPIDRLDSVELEAAVLEVAPYFDAINHRSYEGPRFRSYLNDARNYLLINRDIYDIIISEPSNPWMAGTAHLFTVEFYRQVAEHLSADGIFCQWIQGYGILPDDVRMVVHSVQTAFPHVTLWMSLPGDFFIIASPQPIRFPLDQVREKLNRSPEIRKELVPFGLEKEGGFLSLFLLGEKDVRHYVRNADLNTDRRLLLEFSTPKSLYDETVALVLQSIKDRRTEPLPPIETLGVPIGRNPEFLVQIGIGYLHKGMVGEAQEKFEQALALDAHHAPALVGLGRCEIASGQLLKALKHLEEAVDKAPASGEAKAYLGLARLRGGDAAGAWEALREALTIDERNWEFFFWTGEALEALKRWPEAAEAYAKSAALEPDRLAIRLQHAHALTEAGHPEEAAALLESLRKNNRRYAPLYSELSFAYEKTGRFEPATEAYEELVRLNPYAWQHWSPLASLYFKQKDAKGYARAVRAGKKLYRYFMDAIAVPKREED